MGARDPRRGQVPAGLRVAAPPARSRALLAYGELDLGVGVDELAGPDALLQDAAALALRRPLLRDLADAAEGLRGLRLRRLQLLADELRHLAPREGRSDRRVGAEAHRAGAPAGARARPPCERRSVRRPRGEGDGRAAPPLERARRAAVDAGRVRRDGPRAGPGVGDRERPHRAVREAEVPDARVPRERRRRRVVLLRVPEGALVARVDADVAVVAPAVAGGRLTAGARKKRGLTLRELVRRVAREPSRVADLRIDRRRRGAEADRQVTGSVHRGAPHPAPGAVRLVGALLGEGRR